MKIQIRAFFWFLTATTAMHAQLLNVTSTGLGINTSAPTEKTQIQGNLIVGGGTGAVLEPYSGFSSQQNPFLEIKGDPSGTLGIPALLFSAGGRSTYRDFGGAISWESSDYSTADKRGAAINLIYSGTSYDAGSLAFNTRASGSSSIAETMRLSSAGNLGVGTANPAARLHLGGSNPELRFDYGPGYDTYYGSLRWSGLQLGNNGDNRIVAGRTSSGGSLSFWVNNTNEGADYSQTPNGTLAMVVASSGNIGIGTGSPGYKLEVAGSVRATSFISNSTTYADFVFKPGYPLRPLAEVEAAIARDGHLPDVPSETEVKAHGVDLASQQAKLLQKVEELTLYAIEQNKLIEAMEGEISRLRTASHSHP